jgi:hypothetical protein
MTERRRVMLLSAMTRCVRFPGIVRPAVRAAPAALSVLLALAPTGCTATRALEPESPAAREANTTDAVDGAELPALEGRIEFLRERSRSRGSADPPGDQPGGGAVQ